MEVVGEALGAQGRVCQCVFRADAERGRESERQRETEDSRIRFGPATNNSISSRDTLGVISGGVSYWDRPGNPNEIPLSDEPRGNNLTAYSSDPEFALGNKRKEAYGECCEYSECGNSYFPFDVGIDGKCEPLEWKTAPLALCDAYCDVVVLAGETGSSSQRNSCSTTDNTNRNRTPCSPCSRFHTHAFLLQSVSPVLAALLQSPLSPLINVTEPSFPSSRPDSDAALVFSDTGIRMSTYPQTSDVPHTLPGCSIVSMKHHPSAIVEAFLVWVQAREDVTASSYFCQLSQSKHVSSSSSVSRSTSRSWSSINSSSGCGSDSGGGVAFNRSRRERTDRLTDRLDDSLTDALADSLTDTLTDEDLGQRYAEYLCSLIILSNEYLVLELQALCEDRIGDVVDAGMLPKQYALHLCDLLSLSVLQQRLMDSSTSSCSQQSRSGTCETSNLSNLSLELRQGQDEMASKTSATLVPFVGRSVPFVELAVYRGKLFAECNTPKKNKINSNNSVSNELPHWNYDTDTAFGADVRVVVEDEIGIVTFAAHRAILASASPKLAGAWVLCSRLSVSSLLN